MQRYNGFFIPQNDKEKIFQIVGNESVDFSRNPFFLFEENFQF
jgi:hypothetical protein